jgi:hypothetical protein
VDEFDSFIIFIDDFHTMHIFIQLKNDQKRWINSKYLRLK